MSSLWTPDGEHHVPRPGSPDPEPSARDDHSGAGLFAEDPDEEISQAELERELEEMRARLAETPAAAIVANHCIGLFDLARVYLSLNPPQLEEASLAIDGLAALADGLLGRLGPDESTIRDALASIRLAFVQIKAAATASES